MTDVDEAEKTFIVAESPHSDQPSDQLVQETLNNGQGKLSVILSTI